MYLVNYTSQLFKGASNNNWSNSQANKKSDIFTKTQKLGGLTAVFRSFPFNNKIGDIFQ